MTLIDKLLLWFPRLAAHIFRPVRLLDRRVAWIERFVQTPISDDEMPLIREACRRSGVTLGEFYHWYLQKRVAANSMQYRTREKAIALSNALDGTNYDTFSKALSSNKGLLITVPHHAHYILSIMTMAEMAVKNRSVMLFIGEPDRNPGNDIFDTVCDLYYGGTNINITTVHNTRKGLTKVMRGLKEGAVVFIMPDAFQDESSTLTIPFCGSSINIMMGAAILARKTGSQILPAISTKCGKGLGFRTEFAPLMSYTAMPDDDELQTKIRDYAVMRQIFCFYEIEMEQNIVYWQQARRHLSQKGTFKEFDPEELSNIADLLVNDPVLTGPKMVVDLRPSA